MQGRKPTIRQVNPHSMFEALDTDHDGSNQTCSYAKIDFELRD